MIITISNMIITLINPSSPSHQRTNAISDSPHLIRNGQLWSTMAITYFFNYGCEIINPGWWFQPLLKNISRLGLLFPIYGNIKNVPSHQPESLNYCYLIWLLTLNYGLLN